MKKLRIITDSASDIRGEYRPEITVLPMQIRFGEEEFLDGVNLSSEEFYTKLIESDELPVTSLVGPAVFAEHYQKAIDAGEEIIVITLSHKFSGTFQSATLAADDFEEPIYLVDSMNVATGEKVLVEYALQLYDQGMGAKEIAEELERSKDRILVLAVLDTLEYLKKGGRISQTAAFIGGTLSIKPVVTVKDGEVVMLGKARGSKNGNNFLMKKIDESAGIDFEKPVNLGYTGLSDSLLVKYMEDSSSLWKDHIEKLPICVVGPTVGTHVGPGAIVVSFFVKES